MAFDINTFTSNLVGGGALSSLFEVTITGKGLKGSEDKFQYLCKAASLPSSTITTSSVTYMGRPITIPGNRDAQQWTNTIYNDEDMSVRNYLESWMETLNSHSGNVRGSSMSKINSYTGTLTVSPLAKEGGGVLKVYKFQNAWPSSVADVTLDWETNEIQTFDVTWEFSHWTSDSSGIV